MTVTYLDGLPLVGGRLCLDFVNTIDPRVGPDRHDYLQTYDDLLRWVVRAGAVAQPEGSALQRRRRAAPERAASVLADARALREALFDVLLAASERRRPERDALALVNEQLRHAFAHADLQHSPKRGFAWGWHDLTASLDAPLWAVLRSTVDLLLTPGVHHRLRVCGGALEGSCGWLFYDTSKSGRRRWCRMQSCGARAKARSYRQRQRRVRKGDGR